MHIVNAADKLVRARICRDCADGGITIVPQRLPAKPTGERTVRNPQLDAIKRRIEVWRSAWYSPAGGVGMAAGKVEAYDQCIALIDAAQEGRPL